MACSAMRCRHRCSSSFLVARWSERFLVMCFCLCSHLMFALLICGVDSAASAGMEVVAGGERMVGNSFWVYGELGRMSVLFRMHFGVYNSWSWLIVTRCNGWYAVAFHQISDRGSLTRNKWWKRFCVDMIVVRLLFMLLCTQVLEMITVDLQQNYHSRKLLSLFRVSTSLTLRKQQAISSGCCALFFGTDNARPFQHNSLANGRIVAIVPLFFFAGAGVSWRAVGHHPL